MKHKLSLTKKQAKIVKMNGGKIEVIAPVIGMNNMVEVEIDATSAQLFVIGAKYGKTMIIDMYPDLNVKSA